MDNENVLREALDTLKHGDIGIRCFDPVQNHDALIVRGSDGRYMVRTKVSDQLKEYPIELADALTNCQTYIEHMIAKRSIEGGSF
ncbi:MAG: hypothetical protein Q8L37_06290 [Candidatus Gottesmanbacteria bacterium]|nr:hypothetical protein [Candidatus Gottesmanbacteria bacterium]